MTPALLIALKEERLLHYEALALPFDKLAFMFASSKNVGKYDDQGKQIEAPKELKIEDFRTYYLRRSNLAAKSTVTGPKVDHSLYGAYADRQQFESWAGHSHGHAVFVPTKEN